MRVAHHFFDELMDSIVGDQTIVINHEKEVAFQPAEFIEHMGGTHTGEERAMLATEEVLDKMEMKGASNSVVFEDPVITATIIRLGGWPELCQEVRERGDKIHFWKNEFSKMYRAVAKQGIPKSLPSRLPGLDEKNNIRKGYQVDGIVRLPRGDEIPIDQFYGFTEKPTIPQIEEKKQPQLPETTKKLTAGEKNKIKAQADKFLESGLKEMPE